MSGSSMNCDTIASPSSEAFAGRCGAVGAKACDAVAVHGSNRPHHGCGTPSVSARVGGDRPDQPHAVDRLGEVFVAAGLLASVAVVRHGVGRQRENRPRVAAARAADGSPRSRPSPACSCPSGSRRTFCCQGFGDRQPAVFDVFDLGAGPCTRRPDEFPIVVAVFGQQDAHSLEFLRRRLPPWPALVLRLGGPIEHGNAFEAAGGNGQGEGAALAPHAGHGQLAAEQMGDLLRDGQPQARAAELLRRRTARLGRTAGRTAGGLPRGCRSPCRSPRSARPAGRSIQGGSERGHDPHAPFLGELDGVADEIDRRPAAAGRRR